MVKQTWRILSDLDVQEQVEEVVTGYAVKRTQEAVRRAEAVIAGEKTVCKCPQCVQRIAYEANSWLAFLQPNLPEPRIEHHYEPEFERGGWRLRRTAYRIEPIPAEPDYQALDQPDS